MELEVKIFKNKAEILKKEGAKTDTEVFEFDYFANVFLGKLDHIIGQRDKKKLKKLEIVCTEEASQLSCRVAKAVKQGLMV